MYINNNITGAAQACYFQKEFSLIGYKTINHFYVLFEVGVGALMFLHDADVAGLDFLRFTWATKPGNNSSRFFETCYFAF